MEWNDGWPLTAFIGRSRRCCCAVDLLLHLQALDSFRMAVCRTEANDGEAA